MTNFCKSNIRRVINYTNKEPLNKYDLWLSENLRYNEDGELEYDNSGLPACDLILKIFRNGKWEPIVGYNTTAENKINIVTGTSYSYTFDDESYTSNGKLEFDLPLFTKDSPLELFSAGPLGVALNNFVTDEQWGTIYDNHLKTIIEQYPFDLWPAESNVIGGIWADRFDSTYTNTSTWMAQCKYKYNASSDYNLYVHAKDIIVAINTYQDENPSGDSLDIPFATTEICGGILADTHPNTDLDREAAALVRFTPTESTQYDITYGIPIPKHHLTITGNQIVDVINTYNYDLYQSGNPLSINGGFGIQVSASYIVDEYTTNVMIKHDSEDRGKYLKIKDDGTDIEWTDVYTLGVGIHIDSSDDSINIDTSGAAENQVLSYDGSGNVYWLSINGTNIVWQEVDCNNHDITVDANNIVDSANPLDEYASLEPWNYYSITNFKAFDGFSNIQQNNNPIYILITLPYTYPVVASGESLNVIDSGNCLSGPNVSSSGTYLFTLLFGAVKVEKIQTVSNLSNPI